ncbi:MAG: methyltransferase [Proteobacteria bacterium]|nr:methyltransferase [Pseudomonadota bacterium]
MTLAVPLGRVLSEFSGVEHDVAERIVTWSETLEKWSRAQRLVGWRTADGLMREGIADAWMAVRLLKETEGPVLDLGSGCGLPALILASALPKRRFHLVESRRKRVAFLRAAIRAMNLAEVTVHHTRLEDLDLDILPVITARAFKAPAEVLGDAGRLGATACVLSVASPAPIASGWEIVRTVPGRPSANRLHALYK